MSAEQLFAKMQAGLNTDAGKAAAKKVNEVIVYEFPDTKKSFVVDLKQLKAYAGTAEDPACTFKLDESVFVQLATGKGDAMSLFMEGKIELDGDTDIAMKLQKVIKTLSKQLAA